MSAQSRAEDDFGSWYEARHSREPFPWQRRLAGRVTTGDWPDALTAPTGAGKTAIIDVWLWARLAGHDVPRRLVYVIDRRLVVDSVADYARALAKSIDPDERPTVVTLRGGITIDDEWSRDPLRPAVIVSTIDQAGSRLLFSGYGVSPRSAPVHAALLGNDVLFVLDEVHLAQPFLRTLDAVAAHRGDTLPSLPFRQVVMSATWDGENALGLDANDQAHPVLARRLGTSKPAMLVGLLETEDVARCLVREAKALRSGGAAVVAVVCNRVATARAAFEALSSDTGEVWREGAILLTGRIRPVDRERLVDRWLPAIEVGSRERGREPLYVVATQTIEVGADLDMDGLVTECAPLSALRQRAGRLNRVGDLDTAPMTIVHRSLPDDPVYGEQADLAWKWLKGVEKAMRAVVDFGPTAMDTRLGAHLPPAEPDVPGPLLHEAHIETLSCTSVPHGMPIAPWLHGWERDALDVHVAWRADASIESVRAAPPLTSELLAVPVHAFRRWSADVADIEGVASGRQRGKAGARAPYSCIRWDGEEAIEIEARAARVGDTLVLPCRAGGSDRYGWAPSSTGEVEDAGDGERRVRLHPHVHVEYRERIETLLGDENTTLGDWHELAGQIVRIPANVTARSGQRDRAAPRRDTGEGFLLRAVTFGQVGPVGELGVGAGLSHRAAFQFEPV